MRLVAGTTLPLVALMLGVATSASEVDDVLFRKDLAPKVRAILDAGGERAALARSYLEYAHALVRDVDALDVLVAPDVKLHDIGHLGYSGLAGLKAFRRGQNAEFAYDRAVVRDMRFPAPEVIEVELCTERTDAAGAPRTILIHVWNRWVGGKLRERRDAIEELPKGTKCGPAE